MSRFDEKYSKTFAKSFHNHTRQNKFYDTGLIRQ